MKHSDETNTPRAGERIYYTGDCANVAGYGRVLRVTRSAKWGTSIEVELEALTSRFTGEVEVEARRFTITLASFASAPGRRFWRYSQWREHRAREIARSSLEPLEVVLERMAQLGWSLED